MGKMNQSAKTRTPKKGSFRALVVGKYLSDFLVYGSTLFWIFFLVPVFFLLSLVFLFFTGESNAKGSDFPIFLYYIFIILFFALIQVIQVEKVEKAIHQDDTFAEISQPKWED